MAFPNLLHLVSQVRKQSDRKTNDTWEKQFGEVETDSKQAANDQPDCGCGEYYHRNSLLGVVRAIQRHLNAHLIRELRASGEPPYDKVDLWHDQRYAQFRDNLNAHLEKYVLSALVPTKAQALAQLRFSEHDLCFCFTGLQERARLHGKVISLFQTPTFRRFRQNAEPFSPNLSVKELPGRLIRSSFMSLP